MAKLGEDIIEVPICDDDESKVLKIGSQLDEQQKETLIYFLKANLDVFAWKHSDVVGMSPTIMCHHLNVNPSYKSVRKKKRSMDATKYEALKEEVDRLLEIGFIWEAHYPKWLANRVLVKKPNEKW